MSERIAHADLSPFNILWWRGEIYLIDFPQAVDIALNPMGMDLLHRDIVRMCGWFQRRA